MVASSEDQVNIVKLLLAHSAIDSTNGDDDQVNLHIISIYVSQLSINFMFE